jgi:dephospho-CoA kinase
MAYVIGLTGNIGSGKSTVLAHLAKLGASIIDADKVAHEVMLPGGLAYDVVLGAFGRDILTSDGQINRSKLGSIVFSDRRALAQLESIVHPAVFTRTRELVAEAPAQVVVIEAIKLLESGMVMQLCDTVWVVTARPEIALARLMAQRGMSEVEAQRRLANQMPEAEKVAHASVVIDNSGSLEETQRQVEAAWQQTLRVLAKTGRYSHIPQNRKELPKQ